MDMKIANVYNAYSIYNTNSIGDKKAGQTDKTHAKDTFSLSERAEDYKIARSALSQIADIREEKVNFFIAKIEAAEYNINAEDIAAKMFQK